MIVRTWKVAAVFVALLMALPAVGTSVEGDPFLPENPLAGSRLFASKNCIRCHSIQGVGGSAGPDLGETALGSFPVITSKLWNHFPRMIEAFAQERVEWPRLSGEESQQLFTFLYFLNYLDKAANADIGERLFLVKNCIRCHSVGGKGGDIGPELDTYQTEHAAPIITAALWNHGPEMMKVMRKKGIPRPEFQERDVIDILAFIRVKGFSDDTSRRLLPPPNPDQGRAIFEEKNCIHCHSVRGAGGTIGPDLAGKDLRGSLSHILSHMWNHGANMWPRMAKEKIEFPEFSPEEMSDLISYLYFLQFEDRPGSAERGRQVFREKRCEGCHMPSRTYEKPVGPNLAEAHLDSPFKIVAEMWNHAPAIEREMQRQGIRWPLLSEDEMRDLLAFVLSL
jgi:mono/diheme cytochrome c family protein